MMLCKILLLVATCLVGTTDGTLQMDDITMEKADVMAMCFDTIVCDMRRAYEMKRISIKPGPELYNTGMGWLAECYDMDWSNIDIFWERYCDLVCNHSLDERRECTKQMILNYANFYEEHCEETMTPTECTKAEETLTEILKILEEYTASGDCNDPEEVMAEIAEEAQQKMEKNAAEVAGDFEEMAEDFPKPPSFG